MKKESSQCPVAFALKFIGGKWTLQIIYELGQETKRFGELKRSVQGISEKMLIQELKLMSQYGIVHREAYPEIPPKVEYSLTSLGKRILPILREIEKFGFELQNEKMS